MNRMLYIRFLVFNTTADCDDVTNETKAALTICCVGCFENRNVVGEGMNEGWSLIISVEYDTPARTD